MFGKTLLVCLPLSEVSMKRRYLILEILFLFFLGCESPVETINISGKGKKSTSNIAASKSAKLTLMIYMAADNDLESYALSNLKALEHADFEKINVIVLLDRAEGYDETNGNWTDTRMFELQHDESSDNLIKSKRLACPELGLTLNDATELDMANSLVLQNFISYVKTSYITEKYALIIWGHGTGWRYSSEINSGNRSRAFAIDDRTGSYMSVHELGKAVRNKGLDVIGFDTCFGGVLEIVYELKDCCEYTVGCAGVTPSSGWNYKNFIESISASDFSTRSIAEIMVESSSVKNTGFINSRLPELMSTFEAMAQTVANTIVDAESQRAVLDSLLTTRTYSYTQNPCDLYLDLLSFSKLYSESSNLNLFTASNNLKNKISQAAFTSGSDDIKIGVHFIPKTASGAMASVHSEDYIKNENRLDQCQFIKESRWWVPSRNGKSGSLLDKLFYMNF